MRTLFRYCFIILLVSIHLGCFAQFQEFSDQLFFKRFNTKEGLSQASVNCILRDSKGFMWFGTDDGLNRFDGSQFKIFRNVPGDSSSIIGNTVQVIREDDAGNIWVGTSEGLNRFDRHREKFQFYPVKGLEYFNSLDLELDRENKRLWVAGGLDGVFFIDLPTGRLNTFLSGKFEGINILKVERVKTKLYLGTLQSGLLSVNLQNFEIREVNLIGNASSPPQQFAIRVLLSDGNMLWVGTEGAGLKKVDTDSDKVVAFFSTQNKKLSEDKVWSLAHSRDSRLWVGTDGGGLIILDPQKEIFSNYKHSPYDDHTISGNTIRSLIVLPDGAAWLGTFNGGISFYPNLNVKFLSFRKDPENSNSLSHNAVLTFNEDNGTLWIGTDGGGLNYLKNGNFYRFKFPPNVEDPTVILAIHRIATGGLLLGTYQNGLYYITPDKKVYQYKQDPADSKSIGSNIVWDIDQDYRGDIWLATELGINKFNLKSGEFTHAENRKPSDPEKVFTSDFLQTIWIDSENTLWAGFYGYLLSYDLKTGQIESFQGTDENSDLPNKQILSIQEDSKNQGYIWLSSMGAGLVRFDKRTHKTLVITEKEGLPNSLIFALRCDSRGNIWFTTNKGLVCYNPEENAFSVFDQNHGVDTAPFKDNAAYITSNGYLIFGGTNGFTAFKPSDISFPKSGLNITFTGFQLFNDEVKIDSTILRQSITETDHITLTHDQAKFISFDFAALQYLAPSSLQYQYMLEGFDDSWNPVSSKKVSFTNLFPAQYKLRVKAGYLSGFWGKESVLTLDVIPAWWMTWYARAGGLLVIIGLGYTFFRYRTYSLKKRKMVLEKIVAEQNREISIKNNELEAQNEELSQHNEELRAHRETISIQNQMLSEAHQQVKEINQSLEILVQQRTEKLNETISRLNKTIKELDAFLYSASHDLVSPLKSILGLVNLAKKENTNRASDVYFEHMEISVRKLEGVIHTLMQHSFNTKADSPKNVINVEALVQEAISEQQFMPEWAKMKFKLNFDGASVCTDIPRMKIILSNLISNAIKYHDPKKDNNQINLKFHKNFTHWTLEISDNGIGIDRERLDRVFDMFYRATESAKGSGLGLYIVKETVERLNGEIQVESEPGQWTKFIARFPVT